MHLTLQELTESGFLAFLRLVGCAYFKKHRKAFPGVTSESLFHSFATVQSEVEQHYKWLEHICQKIWDRITFEDEMITSVSALKRHWQRSCWVLHMWRQAQENRMILAPPAGNGWLHQDGKLVVDWDSKENIQSVRRRVDLLLKGCGCKTGCNTNRCGCKNNGTSCGPGCRCTNCHNIQREDLRDNDQASDDDLEDEVNCIMAAIFGANGEDKDEDEFEDEDDMSCEMLAEDYMYVDEEEQEDEEDGRNVNSEMSEHYTYSDGEEEMNDMV